MTIPAILSTKVVPPRDWRWDQVLRKYGILFILIALLLLGGALSPRYFLSTANLSQILLQSSVLVVATCGVFFTILIAGIDLSVGSVLALSGMVAAKSMVAGLPWWLAMGMALLTGILVGAGNGLLVNLTQLHPFIITLGTLAIFRGLTLIISDARSVFGFDRRYINVLTAKLLYFPVPVWIAATVATLLFLFAQYTRAGRNIYALGGNAQAAWYSGIDTRLHTLAVFMISGLCAAMAGILVTARTGAAEPNAGIGLETSAIAAAIIGGTSFFGGRGNIAGVVAGALIIGVLSNLLNVLNVQSYYQQICMGSLIIAAVTADKLLSRREERS